MTIQERIFPQDKLIRTQIVADKGFRLIAPTPFPLANGGEGGNKGEE